MKKYFAFFVLLVLLTSCEKASLEPIDLLTDGSVKFWKLSAFTQNNTSILTDCYKDDTFTFNKAKGEYLWLKGEKKCDNNDVDQKFTFALSEDLKTFDLSGFKWDVVTLTKDIFEIQAKLSDQTIVLKYVPA